MAFARAAQELGQWTAFREFAAEDAVMFAPGPVNAHDFLKGREDPPQAIKWQPHQVWSSCDGSLAVTKGAWQRPDGAQGYFTTVWERQEDGAYKWVLDQGDESAEPLEAPEMVVAHTAACGGREAITPPSLAVPANEGTQFFSGDARDKTLRWIVRSEADGGRYLAMEIWTGEHFERPLALNVAAPAN